MRVSGLQLWVLPLVDAFTRTGLRSCACIMLHVRLAALDVQGFAVYMYMLPAGACMTVCAGLLELCAESMLHNMQVTSHEP